jgi:5-methylcytosine-specific restriction protein A
MPQKAVQFDNGIRKVQIDNRPSAESRGYDWRWQKYRIAFLKKYPLCELCKEQGIVTAADVVDHIVPHKGDMIKFWDKTNHQSACVPCHNRKTVLEDGGFGYEKKPETNGERVLRVAMAGANL